MSDDTLLVSLGRRYMEAQEKADEAERESKAAAKRAKAAEQALWEAMLEAKTKITVLELGEPYGDLRVQRQETITGNILKGREEEALAALEAEGRADEIFDKDRPVLRKQVLNQLVRDRHKAGEPLPAGVDFHSRKYITASRKS